MQESPKRKAPAKNSANNKSTPQRSKRAAAPTKPIKDESSGENESEDDEPLSKKAKPLPPTVIINCNLDYLHRFSIRIIFFSLFDSKHNHLG